jgi:hypothetical protein
VLRGGSWNNNQENARADYRNDNEPDNRNNNIGFRVVWRSHIHLRSSRSRQVPAVTAGGMRVERVGWRGLVQSARCEWAPGAYTRRGAAWASRPAALRRANRGELPLACVGSKTQLQVPITGAAQASRRSPTQAWTLGVDARATERLHPALLNAEPAAEEAADLGYHAADMLVLAVREPAPAMGEAEIEAEYAIVLGVEVERVRDIGCR